MKIIEQKTVITLIMSLQTFSNSDSSIKTIISMTLSNYYPKSNIFITD